MKKINWFARLFMGWDSIVDYVEKHKETNGNSEEVYKKEIELKDQMLKKESERVEELRNILTNSESKQREMMGKISQISAQLDSRTQENSNQSQRLAVQDEQINALKSQIMERKNELASIKMEINEKLTPLNRIEKTFFAASGNKGKGELGEMQLKVLLQKSGLDANIWQENLIVGSNTVEFAIQSGNDDGKWIPIDSKVLDAELDEEGKIIVDAKYKQRVLTQVKAITKYLGKKNTADYGLLVLQNDSIYMSLYNEFPSFFKEVIEDHKVYITSPSSFVQITWSIAHIIKIYERVHKDQMIYDEMVSVLDSVTKFSTKMVATHKEFNIAMNRHYPTIQKKQEKLVKKLSKEGKIKELPTIELKE